MKKEKLKGVPEDIEVVIDTEARCYESHVVGVENVFLEGEVGTPTLTVYLDTSHTTFFREDSRKKSE